ncbi:MAG: tRNA (guanosine(37)-N1)-methyltransferase TrmD [Lachnospiraceae bacterium]|nr:tRNA (guanosine(37)-N1)-methyltransferase TrmD [Lachnospiraceae bacterium]
MNFHILTLFPEMVEGGLKTSVIGRAVEKGIITVRAHDIRDYSTDKHRKVDDYPYGGGAGMLMQAQPVFDCFLDVKEEIKKSGGRSPRVIYVTPQGKTFRQSMAEEFAKEENLVFLCGHYEGIDERVLEEIVTDYVSVGDYVLTGGELPAMVMTDAVARLVRGVLNNGESSQTESFQGNLLEYPQYSRPEEWKGKKVPEVLLSGDHKKIEQWRLEQSVSRTKERRPDLYQKYERLKSCESYLLKNKLLHMDMLEALRRGSAKLLYFEEDGVLLFEKNSGAYMFTTKDRESGEKILSDIFSGEENPSGRSFLKKEEVKLFVSHQEFMNVFLCEYFSIELEMECIQMVYTRKEPLPVKKGIDIRKLDEEFLDVLEKHYHTYVEEGYVETQLKGGVMYGIFEEAQLAGFIGMHKEESIGMLEIFEKYRNKGYAKALESFYINLHLRNGWTPFGQIETGNEKSLKLQESLNLYPAKDRLYWLGKN